jgi:hypothetical protein
MMQTNNQNTTLPQKSAIHIWIVGAVAVFFNSIGAYDFIMTISNNHNYFSYLGYGARQVDYFANYPIPLAFFWFVGVWAAFAGSICILLRLIAARNFFLAAITGQVVLSLYSFLFRNRWEILGPKLGIQDLSILAFTIILAVYSHYLIKRGLLK